MHFINAIITVIDGVLFYFICFPN